MALNYSTPIQCSDDVPGQPPSFQTGQAVSLPDIQADAERAEQQRPAHRPDGQENLPGASLTGNVHRTTPRDRIIITGGKTRIEAEGLASVLQPGGTFTLGLENEINIYHDDQRKPSKIKNKYKLTESTAEPVIKHLDIVSAGLADDYLLLGRHLGLAEPQLSQIRMDYRAEGQHEINYRVLARWKQQYAPVTVKMLAKALLEIGRGDLADELRHG